MPAPSKMENPPFIEHPDEHEEQGDELYCWMPGNSDRECGGGCVAYDPSFEQDQRRTSCMVLNSIRSAAFALNMLGISAKRQNKTSEMLEKKRQLDELSPPPPEVTS